MTTPGSQQEPPAAGPRSPGQPPISTERKSDGSPHLVFQPDEKKTARIALMRRLLLWATLVIMGFGLLLVIRHRPMPLRRPAVLPDAVVPSFAGSDSPTVPRVPGVPGAGAGTSQVRFEADLVRAAARSAADRLRRARPLMPSQAITGENGAEVLKQVTTALAMLDSAEGELAQAQNSTRRLGELVRGREASEAYRLSVLYAGAMDLVKQLESEARDQSALFRALDAACRAVFAGNQDEAAIKQDVATSHLRRSEARQRRLRRLLDAFEAAASNVR